MKKRDIIIVVVCIAATLVCIGLTFWGNLRNNGVLTTDAFMGVITSLIGVCATIIVGFQIASYLELRETKIQVEKLQKERERLEIVGNNISKIRTDLASAFVAICATTTDQTLKVISAILSICVEECSESCSKLILSRYEYLSQELRVLEKEGRALDILRKFNNKLKEVSIPTTIQDYSKITKLHFNIIARIDKLLEVNKQELAK